MYLLSENPDDYRDERVTDGEEDCRGGAAEEVMRRAARCHISGAWCGGQPFSADQPVLDYCVNMRHWTRVIGVVEWGKILYIPVGKKRPTHTEKYTIHLNGEVGAEYIAQAKRRGERAVWPFVVDYSDADQGVCDE